MSAVGNPTSDGSPSPTVIQWVLDTRTLWPEAEKTSDLPRVASRALALLTEEEKTKVLKFYFVRDAKLILGSILLKRHVISRFCPGVSWDAATPVLDARSKPVFLLPDGTQPVLFNVSHQAGLVVLLGVHAPPPGLAVGVDVVCQAERADRDVRTITTQGWPHYVDIHSQVFSPGEVRALTTLPFADNQRRLAYFYAIWCLREAYLKMTGEALVASWLCDLEIRGFAPPGEEPAEGLQVYFQGKKVDGVDVRLEKLLGEYMVSTVVREGEGGRAVEVGEFESLDIDSVLAAAEASRTTAA
ncbi:hypothetical protein S40288_05749 [Stachybotrys chartarum IBT 40288]|nr:hypothetical protein S40288_05749 [Stachybotrys chartarum IBT 40288]